MRTTAETIYVVTALLIFVTPASLITAIWCVSWQWLLTAVVFGVTAFGGAVLSLACHDAISNQPTIEDLERLAGIE